MTFRSNLEAKLELAEEQVTRLTKENLALKEMLKPKPAAGLEVRFVGFRKILSNVKNYITDKFMRNLPVISVAFLVVGFIIIVSFLTWYHDSGFSGGIVTNLYHHHPYTTTSTSCTGSGSNQRCTTSTHYHPEKWSAMVCNEGDCVRPTLDYDLWVQLHRGSYLCVNDPCNDIGPEHEEVFGRD